MNGAVRPIAWLFRLAAITVASALLLSATVIAAAPRVWRVFNAHEEVPVTLPEFEPLSQRTYVYDVAGNVIAVFERENSQPVKLAQVPPDVLNAILAVEDTEFYEHKGVNVRGLIRAALSNFSSDAPRQGASTITQQVVKNELLAGLERDGRYKLLQVHYALMLEKEMTKDEILERYVNTIFFGNNAYGLQAAAEVYFGKNVEELDMIDGAFLAGLIRSPSGYDPIRRPERSRSRFRQVVDRLVDVEMIPEEGSDELAEGYVIPERVRTIPTISTVPTYYTEALREYLLERSNVLGDTEQARANQLYRGGLKIYTTFDPQAQALAEEARNVLPANAAGIDAAIVSLDAKTGAIRAMVGGRGFIPRDREINMALVPRQTGSSVKFFVLASALQAGAQPNDQIDGKVPCTLPNPGDPKNPFLIRDATGGFGTLEEATYRSLNCAYARLSQVVGLNRVVDTIYRMAASPYLYRGQPEEDRASVQPYASLATGANEMSPLDMASGAQSIANNGVHHEPYYVDRVEKADGTTMYVHESAGTRVLDEGVALTATAVLKTVNTRGTGRHALADFPFPAAGKTGTQFENTNSWYVGYTPKMVTAVWVGDPDGYTKMTTASVPEFGADGVAEVQGGTYPARIWRAMMEPYTALTPAEDWAAPPAFARAAVRLYLPGEECLYVAPVATTTTVPGAEPGVSVAGLRSPAETTLPPTAPPTAPPTETTVAPPETAPPTETTVPVETTTTTAPPPVYVPLPTGTTISPDNLDPRAPLPTTPLTTYVGSCATTPTGGP